MAIVSQFKNHLHEYESTQPDTLEQVSDLVCNDGQKLLVIGFDICNLLNTGIMVNVVVYRPSTQKDFYWIKNAPIPVGATLPVIQKQKQVLMPGDLIKISCSVGYDTQNNQSPLSVIASSMEISLVES